MIPFPSSPFAPVPPGAPPHPPLNVHQLSHYLLTTFPGVETEETAEGRQFFAGPHHRIPFVTLTQALPDSGKPFLRISIGVTEATYLSLVDEDGVKDNASGLLQNTFLAGSRVDGEHLVWIVNPEGSNLPVLKDCFMEAYRLAARRRAAELVSAA